MDGKILSRITKDKFQTAVVFTTAVSFSALHFSQALASITFGLLALMCITAIIVFKESHGDFPILLWFMPLFFIWQAISSILQPGAFEGNEVFRKLVLKIPMLLFPLIAIGLRLSVKQIFLFVLLVSVPLVWISLSSVLHYFQHYAFYNQMVLESKPIPIYSIVYHIEFSVILASFTLVGLFLLWRYNSTTSVFIKYLAVVVFGINAIALHILSARTGILMFWCGGLAGLSIGIKWSAIRVLKYLAIVIVIFLTALTVPSVRNRVANSILDIQSVSRNEDLNQKSFGLRWEAWKSSLYVIKHHQLIGVGLQNVTHAVFEAHTKIKSHVKEVNRKPPHNQYLESGVQSGFVGLMLFLLILVGLISASFSKKNMLLFTFIVGIIIAFVFESLLERQTGVELFVVLSAFLVGMKIPDKLG